MFEQELDTIRDMAEYVKTSGPGPMRRYHDACMKIMEHQRHLLKLLKTNYIAMASLEAKRQGMTFQQLTKGTTLDPVQWKFLDDTDELINEIKRT